MRQSEENKSLIGADYIQAVDARLDSTDAYIEYQFQEARRAVSFLSKFVHIQDADVLEVGAGRGGKGIAYALSGMKLISIDVDQESLQLAKRAARQRGAQVRYLGGDVACLPFPAHSFDAILLDSVIEHVGDPRAVLLECERVLRRDGIVFVVFPPFYGPLSGHIDDYILIPWFHLLPPKIVEKMLLSRPPLTGILLPQDAFDVYATLNRLTVFRFNRTARRAGFRHVYLRVRPFLTHPGMRLVVGLISAMRHAPRLEHLRDTLHRARREFTIGTFLLFLLLAAISPLAFVPILQEIAAGGCKCVLKKEFEG